MNSVRMWKTAVEDRPWAEIGAQGRGHLLAQLLHGNLYNVRSCEIVIDCAKKSSVRKDYVEDLGFFDSVGLYFAGGHVRVDHAVAEYGSLDLRADQLVDLLTQWLKVVASREPTELLVTMDIL